MRYAAEVSAGTSYARVCAFMCVQSRETEMSGEA